MYHSISQPEQVLLWQEMAAIKLNILMRMDKAPPAVRVCCIKFIQKVVQVQTPGVIADPRGALIVSYIPVILC